MDPANERLKTNDAARGQFDFGLVVQHELALVECAAQIDALWPGGGAGQLSSVSSWATLPGLGEDSAKSAEFQFACDHGGHALEHVEFVGCHGAARAAGIDGEDAEDFTIW